MPWECHVWLKTHYSPYSLSRRPYSHDLQHAQSCFLFSGFYLLILRFSPVIPLLKYEACFKAIYVRYITNEWILSIVYGLLLELPGIRSYHPRYIK